MPSRRFDRFCTRQWAHAVRRKLGRLSPHAVMLSHQYGPLSGGSRRVAALAQTQARDLSICLLARQNAEMGNYHMSRHADTPNETKQVNVCLSWFCNTAVDRPRPA